MAQAHNDLKQLLSIRSLDLFFNIAFSSIGDDGGELTELEILG